jgi:hypothetical protein
MSSSVPYFEVVALLCNCHGHAAWYCFVKCSQQQLSLHRSILLLEAVCGSRYLPLLISLAHCTTPVYPIDFVVAVCCSCLQNGRIKGDAKKALRGVIEQYGIPVTLSANQNILLRDVEPAWKEDIQARLEVSTQILSHYHMWGLAVMSLFLVPVSHFRRRPAALPGGHLYCICGTACAWCTALYCPVRAD